MPGVVYGLVRWIPNAGPVGCRCARDVTSASARSTAWSVRPSRWVVSLAIAAPFSIQAMMLPGDASMARATLGTTVWGGVVSLIEDGHAVIGMIVLLCSIVIPIEQTGRDAVAVCRHGRANPFREARPGTPRS